MANGASTEKTTIETPQLMELRELDRATTSAGGWFKKLTHISTPSFLKKLDDNVRNNLNSGWLSVAGSVLSMFTGVPKPFL